MSTTGGPTHNMSIRQLPPGQVLERLKQAHVTQTKIARRVGVTQGFVSRVIHGRAVLHPPSKTSEKVWRAIEKAVNGAVTP